MNGYNLTERMRQTLARSRDEATELRHPFIGTEHILLALLGSRGGIADGVLEELGADREAIRAMVVGVVQPGTEPVTAPALPYTTRAKRTLELAMAEARELNHSYVGTEHLLLGLLREAQGVGAQVLVYHGVTLEHARNQTLRLLGESVDATNETDAAPVARLVRRRPA